MRPAFTSLLAASLALGALASPVAEPAITQAPSLAKRATTCTFSGSNGAASASKSQTACSTIVLSNVAVPSGTTLDLSKLADDTTVIFEGQTTWGYKEWSGPLLQISGKGITVKGASGAYLNPDGARWWDGEGSNGGKTKPKFFYAHDLTSSTITDLHIQNTPVQAVSINGCDGLTITGMTIDNTAGDSAGGHNTDGFDIGSSTNVVITGANVYNQDDCVAVNSGTDITFSGGTCSGGHGLSIGSVGGRDDNTVDTVTFTNSVVKNSVNGIRIKAKSGETGAIKGVTYSGITLQSISKYGILIEQNYNGGDLHGDATSGIPITGLTVKNVSGVGAVSSSGYDVVVTCGSSGCSNWTWSNVQVTGGKTYGSCTNVPSVTKCS
ncbi:Endopolygalacturonase [Penicillium oxalicum]|uniref:endo-polygalacturonase n=2 Tax=Penicillium oxalicum TaxID=69781 RepID=S8ASZ0_PENO1|nr:Endopolygalacturonase [Penicillium oxalicum]APZ75903.1 endo-polygalacturonase [Penicillium oxalicum]EPS29213.1 putative endopolygalacturonase [Penicillium oxalicum 114-2]KAI2787878.1 Endopolygalacturonase [Penicillium oxalicum]